MHKRPLQPTRRWNEEKENCPNRAVLDPNKLSQPMTYRPLGRKLKPDKEADHADAKDNDISPAQAEKPAD